MAEAAIQDIGLRARRWVWPSIVISLMAHLGIAMLMPVERRASIEAFGERITQVFNLVKVERITSAELARETAHDAPALSPEEVEASFRDLLWLPSIADAYDKTLADRPEPTTLPSEETIDRVFSEGNLPLLATPTDSHAADILAGKLEGSGSGINLPEAFVPPARRAVTRSEPAMDAPVPEELLAMTLEPIGPAAAIPEVEHVEAPLTPLPLPPAPDLETLATGTGPPRDDFQMPVIAPPEPSTEYLEVVKPDEPKAPVKDVPAAEEIDLAVEFETYRRPGRPGRFFRLTIGPAPETRLLPLSQDHLFVCDVSFSMKLEELAETRAAVGRIVLTLPKGHRFNLVVFSERIASLYDDFQEPTPERALDAMAFLYRQPEQLRTDICLAIQEIARRIKETTRPVALYLVSDGASTQGIRDARRIITEVSSVIGANVSVFTFNAGSDGNEYLLQLISYVNRGQMVSVSKEVGSGLKLVQLVNRYKAPLLTNVQAAYGNLEVEDVYPARTPNLYHDRPIVLHGRCRASGDAAIRIVADSSSGRKTFFANFKIDPNEQGRPEIAKGWAAGRINYLVSRMAREGPRQQWIDEIKQLGQQYQVSTPYD